ncbi:MAG: hypothetical protein K8T90_14375 [Planctomycetes bacterium]|nr:hypothetical protein [Planctomycetota bacterium]
MRGWTKPLGFCLVAACVFARAGSGEGTIDSTDAKFMTGDAPVRGTVTVDGSAQLGVAPGLGNIPHRDGGAPARAAEIRAGSFRQGLGGPDFVVPSDITLPGGVYDYRSLTISRGVTVRFTSATTIRVAGDLRIEGRLVMDGPGGLLLDCPGDFTCVGHDDASGAAGVYADDDDAYVVVSVGGLVDVSADAGAAFRFEATGRRGQVVVLGGASLDSASSTITVTLSDTSFATASDGLAYVGFGGPATLTDCTATGGPLYVHSEQAHGDYSGIDGQFESWDYENPQGPPAEIHGGSFAGLVVWTRGNVVLGGATTSGGEEVSVGSYFGSLDIDGAASLEATTRVRFTLGGHVAIGDGCVVRTTGGAGTAARDSGMSISTGGWYNDLTIGEDVVVEQLGPGDFEMNASRDVRIAGTVRSSATSAFIAAGGNIDILDGSHLETTDATLRMFAGGAVTAAGGTAELSALEYDVRCISGDLDLDVSSMDATAGRIVAISNGMVRLRGVYTAARDVQVVSLKDAIDVRRATLRTLDQTSAASGFVRLATYGLKPPEAASDDGDAEDIPDDDGEKSYGSRATIDAVGATMTTGSSDVLSGDVLLQIADAGNEVKTAKLRVSRVRARRTAQGVVTIVQGHMVGKLGRTDLRGAGRVTAGRTARRINLESGRGSSDAIDLRVGRGARSRRFQITLRESAATAGTHVMLRFSHAGFHAWGRFRRPTAQ